MPWFRKLCNLIYNSVQKLHCDSWKRWKRKTYKILNCFQYIFNIQAIIKDNYIFRLNLIQNIPGPEKMNIWAPERALTVGWQQDRERCEEGSESDSIESIYKKLSTPKVRSKITQNWTKSKIQDQRISLNKLRTQSTQKMSFNLDFYPQLVFAWILELSFRFWTCFPCFSPVSWRFWPDVPHFDPFWFALPQRPDSRGGSRGSSLRGGRPLPSPHNFQ